MAINAGLAPTMAVQPIRMYMLAYGYVSDNPNVALFLATLFVLISQIKINVTNAYAGSLAWSNFFSRAAHYHPGRVVWLVFNIAISLMLMLLGIFETLDLVPVISPLPLALWNPAKTGVRICGAGRGRMAVTPVRTGPLPGTIPPSPRISVA